eukprot:3486638-Amphidinium_carterae.1
MHCKGHLKVNAKLPKPQAFDSSKDQGGDAGSEVVAWGIQAVGVWQAAVLAAKGHIPNGAHLPCPPFPNEPP